MRALAPFLFVLVGCTASAVGTQTSSKGSSGSEPTGSGSVATLPAANDGTESTEFDALFDAPASSKTTATVRGIWAGSFGYSQADVRVKIEGSSITAAMRCNNRTTVGVTVAAKVTETSIRVLESKASGTGFSSCSVSFKPVSIPKCANTNDIGCFTADDAILEFSGEWLFQDSQTGPDPSFTKLSD